MSGYSLRQLLTWCVEDELIDEYDESSEQDTVIIVRNGRRHECSRDEAATWLTALFTRGDSPCLRDRHSPESPPS